MIHKFPVITKAYSAQHDMARWILKAVAQHALSLLPNSQSWNRVLQRFVTGSLDIDSVWFRRKLRECYWHVENYFKTGVGPSGTVLELGTGWHPILPLAFYLCGAPKVWTIDHEPLLGRDGLREALSAFVHFAQHDDLRSRLPYLREDRLLHLQRLSESAASGSPTELLRELNIEYFVGDARATELESSSIAFFFSNGVIHEIPENVLIAIFAEFKRLAAPAAVMSHYLLLHDEYSTFDASISPFNYLKYSDRTWSLLSSKRYQRNRLRIADYRRIHEQAGFKICYEHNNTGSEADLNKIKLAAKFRTYSREELLVTRSWIVSSSGVAGLDNVAFPPGWKILKPSDGLELE